MQWVWIDFLPWCCKRWKGKCSVWGRKGLSRHKHTNRAGDKGKTLRYQGLILYVSWQSAANQEGPGMAQLQVPTGNVPLAKQTALLIKESRHSTCLSLNSVLQFLASPWNYSSKPITSSHRNQRSPQPLITAKATEPHCLLVHSVPKCSLHMFCVVVCSPLPGCECICLINCFWSHLSSVRCHVFGHPIILGW